MAQSWFANFYQLFVNCGVFTAFSLLIFDEDADPIDDYWKTPPLYPLIDDLAVDYLATPRSPASAESTFSHVSFLCRGMRIRLSPFINLEAQVIIKTNFNALKWFLLKRWHVLVNWNFKNGYILTTMFYCVFNRTHAHTQKSLKRAHTHKRFWMPMLR